MTYLKPSTSSLLNIGIAGLSQASLALFWTAMICAFQSDLLYASTHDAGLDQITASRVVLCISIASVSVTLLFIGLWAITRMGAIIKRTRFVAFLVLGTIAFSVGMALVFGVRTFGFGVLVLSAQVELGLLAGAGLLTGIGSAVLMALIMQFLGTTPPAQTARIIPASFAIAMAAAILVSSVDRIVAVAIVLVLPTVAAIGIAAAHRQLVGKVAGAQTSYHVTSGSRPEIRSHTLTSNRPASSSCSVNHAESYFIPVSDPSFYMRALAALWQPILGNALLSFAFGFLWQYLLDTSSGIFNGRIASIIGQIFGAIVLFIIARYLHRKVNVDEVFKRGLTVFFLIVLLLPLLLGVRPQMFSASLGLIHGLFDVVVWYLIAATAFDTRTNGAALASLSRGVTIGAMAVGMITGIAAQDMIQRTGFTSLMVIVAVGMLYVFSLLLLVHVPEGNRSRPGFNVSELTPHSPPPQSLTLGSLMSSAQMHNSPSTNSQAHDSLTPGTLLITSLIEVRAAKQGLTRREVDVLLLLAQGRSSVYIAEALDISNNTVRTHMQRIYTKLNIHSKQELIDLMQAWEVSAQ